MSWGWIQYNTIHIPYPSYLILSYHIVQNAIGEILPSFARTSHPQRFFLPTKKNTKIESLECNEPEDWLTNFLGACRNQSSCFFSRTLIQSSGRGRFRRCRRRLGCGGVPIIISHDDASLQKYGGVQWSGVQRSLWRRGSFGFKELVEMMIAIDNR